MKLKPINLQLVIYIECGVEYNVKDPKFKVSDHVRISKYRSSSAKEYTQNRPEELFAIKKVKNNVPWTHVTNDLNNEGMLGIFYEKELQKTKQVEFRIENVIARNEAIIVHSIAGLI